MFQHINTLAGRFTVAHEITRITTLGNGLINQTYRIDTLSHSFVLQGINHKVFPEPKLLMLNLLQLHKHIQHQTKSEISLRIPCLIPTIAGEFYTQDQHGQFWRAMELLQPTECREQLQNLAEVAQVGHALAQFHLICSDLTPSSLHDTLPGFHITPNYYRQYQTLLEKPLMVPINQEVEFCRDFIESWATEINILEQAKAEGILIERVIHGDPKLNNFLFTTDTDNIIGLIDLDTVKPGLIHYDIGDCIRSCCHDLPTDSFNLNYCQTLLSSYLKVAGSFFTSADYDYLYAAIKLIPFELGLRFFSDYLAGNQYFKINHPQQNLDRAVKQFKLSASIIEQKPAIENIISNLRNHI